MGKYTIKAKGVVQSYLLRTIVLHSAERHSKFKVSANILREIISSIYQVTLQMKEKFNIKFEVSQSLEAYGKLQINLVFKLNSQ